jgi:hypothetical protein
MYDDAARRAVPLATRCATRESALIMTKCGSQCFDKTLQLDKGRFQRSTFSFTGPRWRPTMLLTLVAALATAADPKLVISVTGGQIEGFVEGGAVRVFRGIPFAAPPLKELRWTPPQPVSDPCVTL